MDASAQIRRWVEDPVAFVVECLRAEPDKWQADFLRAFRGNKRLAMRACKGPGKSTVLAWCAWNFLATRPKPKIVATSITADNLADNLWPEMAKWQARSDYLKRAFTWTKTRIFSTSAPEEWFMSARTWPKSADSRQQADTLAGLHADYLMFILDESGGIPDAVSAAAEAGLATGIETKLIQAGNPTHLEGPLYRACTSERHLWYVSEITADPDDPNRTPRVSIQWAREQIERWGKDNPWVMVNVFGRFPPASLNALLGPDEVSAAMKRHLTEDKYITSQKRLGIDVARFGDDRCFDDKTEILTDYGWKFFKDLSGKEKVMSVGVNDEQSSWGDILHIHKVPFSGELNVLEKKHINFAITDNHRMLVRKNPKSSEYCFQPYRDLPKDFVVRETSGWSGRNRKRKRFTMLKRMPYGGFHRKKYDFDFMDWASFLGWFVSEGNVYVDKRSTYRYRVLITQNPGKKMESIKKLLSKMGLRWRLTNNGKQVEFHSRPIGQYLRKHCGVLAANKIIPKEIKEASEATIKAFLDSFLLGDGTCRKDGTGRVYSTSSKKLANDLQEVLAKIGRAGALRKKEKAGSVFKIDGRSVTRKNDTFVIYERQSFCGKNVNKREVKKVQYTGFVWCVATPKESIYVRRNGVPMWSGNTVIFPRQGLAAFNPVEMRNARSNEVAARVAAAKSRWGSEIEFVDDTGGWGSGVIDSMIQAGFSPTPVNFSSRATDPRYFNKRAEIWFEMAEWIKRGGALPNIPELARELTAPTYTFKNGKFQLEEKDQIKERLGSSPDYADALALTFSIAEMPASSVMDIPILRTQTQAVNDYDPFSESRQ